MCPAFVSCLMRNKNNRNPNCAFPLLMELPNISLWLELIPGIVNKLDTDVFLLLLCHKCHLRSTIFFSLEQQQEASVAFLTSEEKGTFVCSSAEFVFIFRLWLSQQFGKNGTTDHPGYLVQKHSQLLETFLPSESFNKSPGGQLVCKTICMGIEDVQTRPVSLWHARDKFHTMSALPLWQGHPSLLRSSGPFLKFYNQHASY